MILLEDIRNGIARNRPNGLSFSWLTFDMGVFISNTNRTDFENIPCQICLNFAGINIRLVVKTRNFGPGGTEC